MNRQLIIICAAAAAAYAYYHFQKPPKVASGEPIVQVQVPTLGDAALAGEAAFNEKCSACHGKNAAGQEGIAPPLIHIIYETNHHGDASFVRAAKQGVRQHHWPFGNMPPVPDITDQQIANIITYIRTVQRANGIN